MLKGGWGLDTVLNLQILIHNEQAPHRRQANPTADWAAPTVINTECDFKKAPPYTPNDHL